MMQGQLGSSPLCQRIRDRILQAPQRRIPFAEFMELALYHPEYGYYTAGSARLGMRGDFVTAAHLGPDLGELLAVQLLECWHHLGQPVPFQVVEMGPGQGLIIEALLGYLHQQAPDCWAALQVLLVERSPSLRQVQRDRLAGWQAQGLSLDWCSLEAIPPASLTGVIYANELVDAFPVHRVTLTAAGLQEQYVTVAPDPAQGFVPTLGPLSTPELATYFETVGISLVPPAYPLGYTTEVNLAALDWIATVAQSLHRGYLITIDYGYPAERYYSPGRSQGTLQCYFRQAHHNNPFVHIGQQDITAHVDFTTLERQGERHGLERLGFRPQGLFLMALGLGDRLTDLAQLQGTDRVTLNYALQRRETLHQLISPLGMGQFGVLVQGKGLTTPAQKQLRGLTLPPLV